MARRRNLALAAALLMALAWVGALAVPAAAQSAATKPKPVDLNTADLKTIAALPGLGETLAQRIIDGRPYAKLDDLANVKGIGQAKIDGLKDLVTFSKVKTTATATTAAKAVDTTKTAAAATTAAATPAEKTLVNVNKADLATLETLPGVGEAIAKRIVDGRPYKTLDDLGKVKGIGDAKLKDLKDLVAFEDKVADQTAGTKTATTAAVKTAATSTTAAKAVDTTKTAAAATTAAATPAEKTLVNVNKADLATLETLPGVGEAIAKRIVDGRPYKTLDDLGKVKGIGDARLKDLKDLVAFEDKPVATAAAKLAPGEKIDINTATAEQLDALSGIGPVKAKAIVDYRTANGKFKAIEDIMKVKGIKDGEFAKIKDFIVVK